MALLAKTTKFINDYKPSGSIFIYDLWTITLGCYNVKGVSEQI